MSEFENEDLEQSEDLEPEPETENVEAAEAEDPAPEPSPDNEGPQAEPAQDEERLEAFKRIDASFKTFTRNVEKQLADEITDWLFCPLCAAGAIPGYVNRHDLGHVPEEVQANVQMFLGFARETEYTASTGTRTCTGCDGLGKVTTGSRVAEHMTITCPDCKGYGYTPPPGAKQLHSVAVANGQHDDADPHADLETPDRDNWGEPRVLPDGTLNDNYGKQPQFKTRHPIYGETRLLSPEELVSG